MDVEFRDRIRTAKLRSGMSWNEIAARLEADPAWAIAALFGQHPLSAAQAETAASLFGLTPDEATRLQLPPFRGTSTTDVATDPTIYRFHEALSVYGPAIKELINEEFGDGIMSAINFNLTVSRRQHEDGDRVVVTLDGKFLDYRW